MAQLKLTSHTASPSSSIDEINERLDLVAQFVEDEVLRDDVVQLLKRSYDAQRLVQKFSLGRGDPDDLICLARAIQASQEIRRVLSDTMAANSNQGAADKTTKLSTSLGIMIKDRKSVV